MTTPKTDAAEPLGERHMAALETWPMFVRMHGDASWYKTNQTEPLIVKAAAEIRRLRAALPTPKTDAAEPLTDEQSLREALALIRDMPLCIDATGTVIAMREIARTALASRAEPPAPTPKCCAPLDDGEEREASYCDIDAGHEGARCKGHCALAEPPASEAQREPVDERLLYSTDDAAVWAKEFAKVVPSVDQGLMIGWFANCAESAKALSSKAPVPQSEPLPEPVATVLGATETKIFHVVFHRVVPEGTKLFATPPAVASQDAPALTDEQIDAIYTKHWPRTKPTPALRAAARECVALTRQTEKKS